MPRYSSQEARSVRSATPIAAQDFVEIKRPIGICLKKPFKPRDDRIMASATSAGVCVDCIGDAPEHDVHELILQRAKHLRQLQNIGSVVCELSDRPV